MSDYDDEQSESIYDYQPFSKTDYDAVEEEYREVPIMKESSSPTMSHHASISEGELRAKAMELARREVGFFFLLLFNGEGGGTERERQRTGATKELFVGQ
eukprot:CAMPEP_0117435902 /NCGR_PEP_ID=MMETSP0759-20121206/726_1 /TAXON_ID=63605 /ORGANISM="Percolomonas cosmopolitus, Strain WS" /LENGTH=99 /DNA_ID=CAMNT_0005227475 /DNA_START=77 /DNA_END=376 /DNA_ORIENTATION=-